MIYMSSQADGKTHQYHQWLLTRTWTPSCRLAERRANRLGTHTHTCTFYLSNDFTTNGTWTERSLFTLVTTIWGGFPMSFPLKTNFKGRSQERKHPTILIQNQVKTALRLASRRPKPTSSAPTWAESRLASSVAWAEGPSNCCVLKEGNF